MRALPKDVTLRDVVPTLSKPESFVRQVLGVMVKAAKDHGPVVMRLGITGTGAAPNYRLESIDSGAAVVALDGANHKQWPEGNNFTAPDNWSTAVMTKDDVAGLLGELRGFKRR